MRWIDMVEDGIVSDYLDQGNLEAVDTDDVFDVLRSEPRRDVVSFLYSSESETFTLEEIAKNVHAGEAGLYHNHISKLGKLGAVNYDERRDEVTYDQETVEALHGIIEVFED